MDVWNLILYVIASLLALKSLASLMTHHKKVVVQQLAVEYTQNVPHNREPASTDDSQDGEAVTLDQQASAA